MTTNATSGQRLRSSLDGEAKYRELIQEYVEGLPAQVDRIENALQENDVERIRQELHDVRGTAGGLGFRPLTDIAVSLSVRAKTMSEITAIEAEVRSLVDAIRSVEGFISNNNRSAEVSLGQA